MSSKASRAQESIRLPVQNDGRVFIQGFIDSGDIRIRFVPDGFLHEGAFRHFLLNGDDGERFERGPVTVTTHVGTNDSVRMDVVIELQDGTVVEKRLSAKTCDEIEERVDQVRAMLHTYDPAEEPAAEAPVTEAKERESAA